MPTGAIDKLVKNTIVKYGLIAKGDHVIIGLSGGPDSVCLFFALLELKPVFDLTLRAVHVNHKLRPGDAEKDQEYVEALCREAGAACDAVVCDCLKTAKERGVTAEEAGRDLRYEAYYRTAKELLRSGVPAERIKIAVAQNKNDQAETLLMRIIRGTGTSGLSGIDYKRAGELGTTVIRPLLDAGRKDIEDYCKEKGLCPRIDHTNEQPIYTRNKVRLKLIPFIAENFNANILEALARLARNAKEDSAYLWKQAEEAYKSLKIEGGGPGAFAGIEKKTVLSREGLKQADPAIRHRVMLMAFSEIGLYEDIASAHLEAADSVIFSGSASAEAHFPGNYILAVSYGSAAAYLSNEERVCAPAPDLSLKSKVLPIDEYRAALPVKGCRAAAFDCGRIKSAAENALDVLAVRGREEGDFFTPAGMKSGRKKVQDYFVDRKIPKEERARFRLVALGSEALWIFDPLSCGNGEINERYKINENTKDVLLLEIDSEL